ncbi:MAG: NAD(P)-dependent alcohol dehydrogenase [Deltaproteobacteria bacterium]
MRAIVHDRYGPPEVLRLAEVPRPSPKGNEVLIRVVAATVNRTDCGFRRGEPWIARFWSGLARPRFPILGSELSGEIEEVGADVTTFQVGDQVCGLTGARFGAHAEYVCLPADAPIVPRPNSLGHEEAAATWDGPWLALTCLRKAAVGPGQQILIHGASGSIGSSAVQLAHHLGAHVTAVCNTKNLDLVRSLGADEVVDHTRTDFTRLDRTFDVVLDAVGKSTFGACRRLLKPDGRYLSTDLGPWWQNPLLQVWTGIVGRQKAGLAIPDSKRVREDVHLLREIIEAKGLRPVIDRTYPLEEIVEATRYVDTEQKTGSVVIQVADARTCPGSRSRPASRPRSGRPRRPGGACSRPRWRTGRTPLRRPIPRHRG